MAATRATMALALMSLALMQSVSGHEYVHPKSQLRAENLVVRIDPGITLTTNVSAFTEQRQPVEVTWSGVSEPSTQDMIAVYAPANAVPWKTLPVQFMACSALDDDHLRTGAGSGVFKLINLRNAYKFVLLRGGVVHPRLAAQSQVISNSVRIRPTGGHIALHEDQRSVVVQWVSSSPTPQQVQWLPGHHGNATRYRFTATSSSITYRVNQMCGYPANGSGWMHPGYTHSALIPGTTLTPGQRVAYHYGKDGSGWSKQHSFLAPIGPGVSALKHLSHPLLPSLIEQASGRSLQGMSSHQQPQQLQGRKDTEAALVFLAFNDVAMTNPLLFNNPGRGLSFAPDYGENSSTLSTRLGSGAEAGAHLALMVGDLAYAMGYSADWDVFGDQFEDSFTQWPMAVGTGNHERDWPGTGDAFGNTARDSGGECNVPFTYRWYTPANAKLDPRTSYYSFSQGPVHFLVLDSETPSDPDSPQGRFVAADLAALDRTVTPWVVVALHRMMVAPATFRRKWIGDVDVMERLQADYEELFRTHKVDVVISGHEHAYARTCPIFKNACLDAAMPELETPADEPLQTCGDGWRHRLSAFSSWAMGMLEQLGRELLAGILRVGRAGGPAAGKKARHHFKAGAGGPVYVLAGHAGAGFTHGFPSELPEWVEHSRQDINGYLRFSATAKTLLMEAVVSQDGSIMDTMTLHLQ